MLSSTYFVLSLSLCNNCFYGNNNIQGVSLAIGPKVFLTTFKVIDVI
jgi:hypothetical protein